MSDIFAHAYPARAFLMCRFKINAFRTHANPSNPCASISVTRVYTKVCKPSFQSTVPLNWYFFDVSTNMNARRAYIRIRMYVRVSLVRIKIRTRRLAQDGVQFARSIESIVAEMTTHELAPGNSRVRMSMFANGQAAVRASQMRTYTYLPIVSSRLRALCIIPHIHMRVCMRSLYVCTHLCACTG